MTESNEIQEIEKEARGIVQIEVQEKPKKVKKEKHLFIENDIIAEKSIKGDFDEKIPIQNLKPIKKVHYKPFISEISEEKAVENPEINKIEDLQKEIDNQKKALELRIKEAKEEQKKLLTEQKLKLKAEKKELKLKKKSERKERRRKHWYFRMFMKKEKKPIEIKEIVYSNPNEIKLIEANDTILKICPVCNSKIKKQKVIQEYGNFRQLFKCKKCPFSKEIVIKL